MDVIIEVGSPHANQGGDTHSFAQHDLRRLDRRGSDISLQDTRLQKSLEGLMGNDRTDISGVLTYCLPFEKAPPSIGKVTAQTGARSWFLLLCCESCWRMLKSM